MFEIQVVDDRQRRHLGVERHPAIGRQETVNLIAFQRSRDTTLEKQAPQNRVACLRAEHHRMDVGSEDELRIRLAVEQKEEFMFRMGADDATERFGREPADAVEAMREQQTRVDSYAHDGEN